MMNLHNVRSAIYDQFLGSSAGAAHFFLPANADAYAAYYTSMYLIQDTGEAIMAHMARDFSKDPLSAYLEFWGVTQEIVIQQDAIWQIYQAVVGNAPTIKQESNWRQIRERRNLCAGHPAKRDYGVTSPQRTFMGRGFGNYNHIQYELWDSSTNQRTHPVFDLRMMIQAYDAEASDVLKAVLSTMKTKWP